MIRALIMLYVMFATAIYSHAETSADDNPWKIEEKTQEKEQPVKKVKKKVEPAERAPASAPSASNADIELNLRTENGCYVVNFKSPAGTLPSCSELLPLTYTKRNCSSSQVEETGESQAVVDCADPKRISIKFKSSDSVVSTTLLVLREKAGRRGIDARYIVQNERADTQSPLMKMLPDAVIKPTVESKPEESPLKFKISGYASLEFESLKGFGFLGNNRLPNIPEAPTLGGRDNYSGFNLLSNVNIDVTRDQTTLSTVLEVGELYFGDSGTGGSRTIPGTDQMDRKAIIELRNFYLTHEFTNRVSLQGGLMPLSTDTRSFIFADNVNTLRANYKADLYDGYIYFGQGFKSDHPSSSTRPLTGYNKNEKVAGASGSFQFFDGLKATFFGNYYQADNLTVSVAGSSETAMMTSYFFGTTLEFGQQDALNGQFTAIGNWNNTQAQSSGDKYTSYLLDGKVTFVWERPRINFTLEGLLTPGSTDGNIGSRKNFQSNTATHYIFNIAGNDGWDDASGSARDYVVGKTSNQEGMRILALTTSTSFTKKTSAYVRGGVLGTSADHAVTHSSQFGKEFDFGMNYQATPSTLWQVDFGEFIPGSYFGPNIAPVYFTATKIKFSF